MAIKIGTSALLNTLVGSSAVQSIYQGANLAWARPPNINFSGEWNSAAAQAVWTANPQSSFPETAFFTAGYQETRSYVYFTGSSAINVGGNIILTDYAALQPDTDYNLVVDLTNTENDGTGGVTFTFLEDGVGLASLGTTTYVNYGSGTITIPFKTNAGGAVGVRIRWNAYIDGGQSVGKGRTYRLSRAVLEYA